MRGLVAVGVLADQPGQVGLFAAGEFLVCGKKLIELCDELLCARPSVLSAA